MESNSETIEKATTLVSNSFEMPVGWSGKRICFVSSAALMAASQIPLQHARMLRMKTGLGLGSGEEEESVSVRMRGTSIEPREG